MHGIAEVRRILIGVRWWQGAWKVVRNERALRKHTWQFLQKRRMWREDRRGIWAILLKGEHSCVTWWSSLTLGILTFLLRRLWVDPHLSLKAEKIIFWRICRTLLFWFCKEGNGCASPHIPTYRFCLILYSWSRLMAHGRTSWNNLSEFSFLASPEGSSLWTSSGLCVEGVPCLMLKEGGFVANSQGPYLYWGVDD